MKWESWGRLTARLISQLPAPQRDGACSMDIHPHFISVEIRWFDSFLPHFGCFWVEYLRCSNSCAVQERERERERDDQSREDVCVTRTPRYSTSGLDPVLLFDAVVESLW